MLALAGCGSRHASVPRLAHANAAALAALAGRIAVERPCAQRRDIGALQRRAIALVNAGRVPDALQEPFLSGFAALVAESPACQANAPARPAPPSSKLPTPSTVEPVPHAASVEREARNLQRWLEAYATSS